MGDTAQQLKSYLDVPDRKGDLLYMQKLVAVIEQGPNSPNQATATPTNTPKPTSPTNATATFTPVPSVPTATSTSAPVPTATSTSNPNEKRIYLPIIMKKTTTSTTPTSTMTTNPNATNTPTTNPNATNTATTNPNTPTTAPNATNTPTTNPNATSTPTTNPIPTAKRRVNAPHFTGKVQDSIGEMAIFWFGQVDNANNYGQVRVGYNDTQVVFRVTAFDRYAWYNTNPTDPNDLAKWDSATIYLDLDGDGGSALNQNNYRLVAQLSNGGTNPANRQAIFKGTTGIWELGSGAFESYPMWQGWDNGPPNNNDSTADEKGWRINFYIPFSTLGLSGPPKSGSYWNLAVLMHDRDNATDSPAVSDKTWPESLSDTKPDTWGQLVFSPAPYQAASVTNPETLILSRNTGVNVVDIDAGGGPNCGDDSGYKTQRNFGNWGNYNRGGATGIYIQDQDNVADWPCYSKAYLKFPLDKIPTGKAIISATLTLSQSGGSTLDDPANPAYRSYIQIFSISEDWSESTLTWNNAPLAKENLTGTWIEPIRFPPAPNEWTKLPARVWDVTQVVAEAYAARQTANLAMYEADEHINSGKQFVGSDTPDWNAYNRPVLKVIFGNPVQQPIPTATSTPTTSPTSTSTATSAPTSTATATLPITPTVTMTLTATPTTIITTTPTITVTITPTPTITATSVITVASGVVAIAADSKCSLREAIVNANNDAATYPDCPAGNGADTIILPGSTYSITDTFNLTDGKNGLPSITSTMTINGNMSDVKRSSSDDFRIFHVGSNGNLTLYRLIIYNGKASNGGGIFNLGVAKLTNCTIANNSANDGGGGIYNKSGQVTVTASTISGNSSTGGGGGIYSTDTNAIVTLTNSTLSGNTATFSGGGFKNISGTLTIINNTIVNNSVTNGNGGGIKNNSLAVATIKNTIIAGNNASSAGPDVHGDFISNNFNLVGFINISDTTGFTSTDKIGITATAVLSTTLANNGGDTKTHALVTGSPAIDAANSSDCPSTDQRGESRPKDGDGKDSAVCDIGSYESPTVVGNSIPTDITLTPTSVSEWQPSATTVGTFSTADLDISDSHTYTLVSGTGDSGNSNFIILSNTLKTNAVFDYEITKSYTIRVKTDDGRGGTFSKTFVISVTNVNETPTNITLSNSSVVENENGATVGTLSTVDPDVGDTHTYIITDSSGLFEVTTNTLKLKSGLAADYEKTPTYGLAIRTQDAGGLTFTKSFTVSVTNKDPDLVMTKAVTPTGSITAGQTITYTLIFSNVGQDTATGVIITDTIPFSLTNVNFVSSSGLTRTTGTTYTWQGVDLNINTMGVITITAQAITNTIITNTASITNSNGDSDLSNNNRSVVN